MNYLCHALLSDQTATSFAGTVGGDIIKGRYALDALPEPFRSAVREHRLLDELSRDLKFHDWIRDNLPQHFEKFTGIFTDLIVDHLLIRHWQEIAMPILKEKGVSVNHQKSPADYNTWVKASLADLNSEIPEKLQIKLEPIIKYDLLTACETTEGLETILQRITQRFKRYPPSVSLENGLPCFYDRLDQARDLWIGDLEYLRRGLMEFGD